MCNNVTRARFTPTGVGTIRRASSDGLPPAVHPHGRGDNWLAFQDQWGQVGSPPRAWGQCDTFANRIYANAVHPHGRGDNEYEDDPEKRRFGSPPRAWGQFNVDQTVNAHQRFTPTGVGTICPIRSRLRFTAVHPHGRGDNRWSVVHQRSMHGSPPRAWGQFIFGLPSRNAKRFTPTGVGTITASAG